MFPGKSFKPIEDKSDTKIDTQKIFKIDYTINLLPSAGEHIERVKVKRKFKHRLLMAKTSLPHAFSQSMDLEIFETSTI